MDANDLLPPLGGGRHIQPVAGGLRGSLERHRVKQPERRPPEADDEAPDDKDRKQDDGSHIDAYA